MIPYGRQNISEADIQAVVDVLRSDFLTQGPAVPAFEKAVVDHCGARYGVAVNSATSALHLACLALGVGKGDVVWTTPITFLATANCVLYCTAKIDFVDIDLRTYNLCAVRLEEKLLKAKKEGCLPKVLIPVHLCGESCDMAEIYRLSQEYGFRIIEDASHAIGGRAWGKAIGGCFYSDITIFSFHPVKIITTGEGGMALTNDANLAKRMQLLRSHGVTRDLADMDGAPDGPWSYQQIELGFNYRMTDLQAALGLSQMQRLGEFVAQRHVVADRYDQLLAGFPVILPSRGRDVFSSFHLYVVRLELEKIKKTHLQVFEFLREKAIAVNLHYMPIYLHPYYQRMGFDRNYCPRANRYYAEAISLPIYPGFSEEKQCYVVDSLKQALATV
jgi:UDP-4-amino-4,6-dideoxy-N-acetyl-beta-L-altrosamine transaminase